MHFITQGLKALFVDQLAWSKAGCPIKELLSLVKGKFLKSKLVLSVRPDVNITQNLGMRSNYT